MIEWLLSKWVNDKWRGFGRVSIYYKYTSNVLQIFDYSIQFIIDGKPGINVANQESAIPDPLYSYLFKTTYKELHDNILTQIK